MGKLIVIEGLDGSGKATQAELLTNALKEAGKKVRKVTFPNYESDSSALVKMYLSGVFGSKPSDVNAYAASTFYSVDRYASYKTQWQSFYQNDGIIVADRYTTSNAVHQCSKLPQQEWDKYLEWLLDLEFNKIGIPTPDCVIYLDMSPEVSQKLMSKRYAGQEEKKDIHEKNVDYLNASRKAAVYCSQKLGWQKIACDDAKTPYTIDQIGKMVYEAVNKIVF
ncbi:MAG: deoxynucleoside kinase [Oscillospiraceae bacterium]|nr:deoxynucleoside kinase [Oscillospiraceae bacterium]